MPSTRRPSPACPETEPPAACACEAGELDGDLDGELDGQAGGLRGAMGSPDLLVLFTSTMSHKMLRYALSELGDGETTKIVRSHTSSGEALRGIMEAHAKAGYDSKMTIVWGSGIISPEAAITLCGPDGPERKG